MPKSLTICGPIASGKSRIINELSDSYGWDVISFSSYIRAQASSQGVAQTRSALQSIGNKMISELGHQSFLARVIDYYAPRSNVHLFDGVRHLQVILALRELYRDTLVIFLKVGRETRYQRFLERAAPYDSRLTYAQFIALANQPVEREVYDIAEIADIRLNAERPLCEVVRIVQRSLFQRGFFDRNYSPADLL